MEEQRVLKDIALLAGRLVLGASIAAHGAQKMFGAFGGPGLEGASKMMESLGFKPGTRYAQAASASELGAGALIALGALGPIGPAVLASVMLVAVETVHRKNGFFAMKNGFELNTMYATIALLLATLGYGRFSLDEVLGVRKRIPTELSWLVLGGGVLGGIGMLSRRTPQTPTQNTVTVERGTVQSVGASS